MFMKKPGEDYKNKSDVIFREFVNQRKKMGKGKKRLPIATTNPPKRGNGKKIQPIRKPKRLPRFDQMPKDYGRKLRP